MSIDFNKYGISPNQVEKTYSKTPKPGKEFNNIEEAIAYASKDKGDEAIITIKNDNGEEGIFVLDINEDVEQSEIVNSDSKIQNIILLRNNGSLEQTFNDNLDLDSEIELLKETYKLLENDSISGFSENEAFNHPDKAEIYKNNLSFVVSQYSKVIEKVETELSKAKTESNSQKVRELESKLSELKTFKTSASLKENKLSINILETKIWTIENKLQENESVPSLSKFLSDSKQRELTPLKAKLEQSKYKNAQEGSYFYKEGLKIKEQVEALESEISFLNSNPPPSDKDVIKSKTDKIQLLEADLKEAKHYHEKQKIRNNIQVLEAEVAQLQKVKPLSSEEKESLNKELETLKSQLPQLISNREELSNNFIQASSETLEKMKTDFESQKAKIQEIKSTIPVNHKLLKEETNAFNELKEEYYILDNQYQDVQINKSIDAFKSASTKEDKDKYATEALNGLVKKLSKYFNDNGEVSNSTVSQLGERIFDSLQDSDMRQILIHKFNLNTPENLDILVLTMGAESHGGVNDRNWLDTTEMTPDKRLKIREDIFPIGAAAMNRHLTTLMVQSTQHYIQNNESLEGFKPPSMEKTLSIGRGTKSPLVAYAALDEKQIEYRLSMMKDEKGNYVENYQEDEKAAKQLLGGEVNMVIRESSRGKKDSNISDPEPGNMSIKVIENTDNTFTVNTGTLFNYASPADVIPIMDMGRGWVRTPNQHKVGTFSPGSKSFFRLAGIPGKRDVSS